MFYFCTILTGLDVCGNVFFMFVFQKPEESEYKNLIYFISYAANLFEIFRVS